MTVKFNKISTESNFIKSLLANTYLPLVRTIREGDYITEGRLYILKCNIIKCIKSGYIGSVQVLHNTPIAEWKNIGEYHFAEKNGKLCTNYVSNTGGYDSTTHEKLGEYLRALRDMYELNLMPLYNCFSNNLLDAHLVKVKRKDWERTNIIQTSARKETKIYKVPIRFNTDYTICMENVGLTTLAPAFIKNEHLLQANNTNFGNNIDITSKYIGMHSEQCIHNYANLTYKQPIKVRFNNKPEQIKEEIEYIDSADINKGLNESTLEVYFIHDPSIDSANFITRVNADYVVYYDTITNTIKQAKSTDTYKDNIKYYIQRVFENNKVYTLDELKDKTYRLTKSVTKEYEISPSDCKLFDICEHNLYMLIQVPNNFIGNITVLEGDYTDIESTKEVVDYYINTMPQFVLDALYTHNLSLMHCDSIEPSPFSKSLIEYLLWNAMSDLDSINNNMDRLQGLMRYWFGDVAYHTHLTNFWQPYYRALVSRFSTEYHRGYVQDSLGYVDRKVEELMYKGK